MEFELQRIYRILNDLKAFRIKKHVPIVSYKKIEGNEKGGEISATETWDDYHTGELWGGYDQHAWFRTTIDIPKELNQERVIFHLNTGNKEGWDISNPQFLVYINHNIIQGLDVNHRNTILSTAANVGDTYEIALLGYAGLNNEKVFFQSELQAIDVEIEAFYYDLNNLFVSACVLNQDDYKRHELIKDLNQVIDGLDLQKIYSSSFYTSLKVQQKKIRETYYSVTKNDGPVVTAIGHTHIDIAWLWTLDQTKEKVIRSFSTVLYLMEWFPEYKFMSSQPQLYEFLKEEAPAIFEKVKEKVNEGRWEVDGAMWVEADCNIPSGESLVRQLLYGTRFIKKEFGKTCHTLWLPDVFGYSSAIPQLLKKSGIENFFTTKLDWNQTNTLPHDTFFWEGLDGSTILTHLVSTSGHMQYVDEVSGMRSKKRESTYNGRMEPNQILGTWTNYKDQELTNETLHVFGFGDGGGGPTEEQLQNIQRLKYGIPGIPRVQIDFQQHYFDRLRVSAKHSKHAGKWVGELYFENHRGTYTSMASIKRNNRKAEVLLHNIEALASLNMIMGGVYPFEELYLGWKTLLKNQFHDIIPGSSIEAVYTHSDIEFKQLFDQGEKLLELQKLSIGQNILLDGDFYIVFNTLSHIRNDVMIVNVKDIQTNCLIAEDGTKLVGQLTEDKKDLIFYFENIPAYGYATYKIGETVEYNGGVVQQKSSGLTELFTSSLTIENSFYNLKFDTDFNIISLFDKTEQREIISIGTKGNVLEVYEDRPMDFENWNIDQYHMEKRYELLNVSSVEITEDGPIRKCIKIQRNFYDSTFIQWIYLYDHLPKIDFLTHVDWHENHLLLKVAFPVDIHAHEACYETQFGNVYRNTHTNTSWDEAQFEVCAQRWVDLSEDKYGVSLMNDCKYGHSIKDGIMRLTLVKSGQYPNPNADQGQHEFTYSILPHKGSWKERGTQRYAAELNNSLTGLKIRDNDSLSYTKAPFLKTLPSQLSIASIDLNNCDIEVIKKAEDDDDLILRIYEFMNRRCIGKIKLMKEIKNVFICDLLENPIKKIDVDKDTFEIKIMPYEIMTLKVSFLY